MSANVRYEEHQRFRRTSLYTYLIFVPAVLLTALLILQLIKGPVGNRPAPNLALAILIAIFGGTGFLLARRARLTIMIDDEKILYGWNFPTKDLNILKLERIESAEVAFLSRWLGPGYKVHPRYGTIYNLDGHSGLHIKLKSGEKVFIGSQRPDDLKKALEEIKSDRSTQHFSPAG